MELDKEIKNKIKQQGDISFAEFMQSALYNPNDGYYTTKFNKIGKGGDFTTAPEISSLFGFTLAKQIQQIFSDLSKPSVLEFGAGTGKLCVDILMALEKNDSLPDVYYILDLSGELKITQQNMINKYIPHLRDKVVWLKELPTQPLQGVIIANEVLDAMPVKRFVIKDSELFEVFVTLNNSELTEKLVKNSDTELTNYVAEFVGQDYKYYQSEANLFIDNWIKSIFGIIEKGTAIVIDYGFPAHEYYHSDRNYGTLMCHYQQKAHTNPLINIGLQDITAHVNFTHVAEAGHKVGFNISGYTNQASFLINNGILDLLKDYSEKEIVIHNQALKTLLQPSEMGELFKVIALTKNMDIDLNGFQFNDKRVSL